METVKYTVYRRSEIQFRGETVWKMLCPRHKGDLHLVRPYQNYNVYDIKPSVVHFYGQTVWKLLRVR